VKSIPLERQEIALFGISQHSLLAASTGRLVACSLRKRDDRASAPINGALAGPAQQSEAARSGNPAWFKLRGDGRPAFNDIAVALKEMFGNHAGAVGTA